ncbi:protein YgfX [Providencia alcalifaciens]|uniref:protein YgfX n=1 Tax=Providencia alcalifaciens TaxID=126385 RepID=UPI001CC656A9|nr:protein YgfX [Providencia alcalifaciens]
MVLWKSNLSISWKTQLFSTCLHGVTGIILLVAPWAPGNSMIWLPLLVVLVASWAKSQKNISKVKGVAVLVNGNKLQWKKNEWEIIKAPWCSRFGILLTLNALQGKPQKLRLWIAKDSVCEENWRNLNQLLLQYPDI